MSLSNKILSWYDVHGRKLPWRASPGIMPDPYHVWLSEIMLQQTTVTTVIPYFKYFLSKWPTVDVLANSVLDEILHAWQGLGYYARARNLHKCATIIVSDFNSRFPEDEKDLIKLPGIGPYTSAAIAAFAFGQKTAPIDGNIERILARISAIKKPVMESKNELSVIANKMVPNSRPGDYSQALMDIGATICRPKKPTCGICPISAGCKANLGGMTESIPVRVSKKKIPKRVAVAFWVMNNNGEILLRRRAEKGMLGGMVEIPCSDWLKEGISIEERLLEAPYKTDFSILPGKVKHTFTHFHLELVIALGHFANPTNESDIWCKKTDFGKYALPTIMKKIISYVNKNKA